MIRFMPVFAPVYLFRVCSAYDFIGRTPARWRERHRCNAAQSIYNIELRQEEEPMYKLTTMRRPIKSFWLAIQAALLILAIGLLPKAHAVVPVDGPAHLVKDINTNNLGSFPTEIRVVGNTLYFVTDAPDNHKSLWRSDGTPAGTWSIVPQFDYCGWAQLRDIVFFCAHDPHHGVELWRTDGTREGTRLLKDITPGPDRSWLEKITSVGNMFFFILGTNDGRQLWKSDGTEAGTIPIKIVPLLRSHFVDVNGVVFFVAESFTSGLTTYELWKSDGTPSGTLAIKIIPPLPSSLTARQNHAEPSIAPEPPDPVAELVNVNRALFFSLFDGSQTRGLWKSDGTSAGTVLVKDVRASMLINSRGTLFFNGFDHAHGAELWKSDGTNAGTVLVKDINPGAADAHPQSFTEMNGALFFTATGSVRGAELWKSDGTNAGTVRVADINPGAGSSEPYNLTNLNGTLYFSADDGSHGRELWRSDGVEAGTRMVKDMFPGARSSRIFSIVIFKGSLFFNADDGEHGFELWKSDGSEAGTRMVLDIDTRSVGAYPRRLVDVNGRLFFVADDGEHGSELWSSDGTAEGTLLVKDIYPGIEGSGTFYGPRFLTNLNGMLFFVARDNNVPSIQRLWRSDGTRAGTRAVGDVSPYSTIINPDDYATKQLLNVNGTLFFSGATINGLGAELWKSDGTEAGTVLVKDINPGSDHSFPRHLTSVGGRLFFAADDGVHGHELWTSDGTAAGTKLVKDIVPGSGRSPETAPLDLTNINGTLFFTANDSIHGRSLWKSDGTAAGTVVVNNSLRLYQWSRLTNVDGTLFFIADDGVHGSELWKTDGTSAGTTLVKDIQPGARSSNIVELVNVGGTLLFTIVDGDGGFTIWSSDGTPVGTQPIQTIAPPNDPDDYVPANITLSGRTLFFSASSAASGQELWSIPLAAGVDTIISAPGLVLAAHGSTAAIRVSYLNTGLASARALTLTTTLDPRLAYVDDSSGAALRTSGTTLTWQLPSARVLAGRDFQLRLRMPDAPLDTRIPVTLTLTAEGQPTSDIANVEVMVADMHYLPMVR
jgi:ELWxxDGT repeat protein